MDLCVGGLSDSLLMDSLLMSLSVGVVYENVPYSSITRKLMSIQHVLF